MKQQSIFLSFCATVGLIGLLSGCGSGDGTPAGTVSGSASGTAAASGTITRFGSVFVNGKKFETSGSSFIVDGQSGSQSDLKLGMTVAITGSVNGDQRSVGTC